MELDEIVDELKSGITDMSNLVFELEQIPEDVLSPRNMVEEHYIEHVISMLQKYRNGTVNLYNVIKAHE